MKYILSIDGGGIRGVIPACALVELERQIGKPCRDVFDMVAGTSTGALIAAAIAAGLPATQILEIYQKRCAEIFNHGTVVAWAERGERGYAFEPENIYRVLEGEFGTAAKWTLNDCPIRILLTAKGVNKHAWYFVQDNPKNAQQIGTCSLLDCATASAAAPVYFRSWYVDPGKVPVGWCFDGGIGVTGNPVHQSCREAFLYDSFDPTATRVISLGTGWYPDATVNPPSGLLPTAIFTIDCLTDAPIDEQTEIVEERWPGIMQRFNWQLPSSIDMADTSAIPGLVELGQRVASQMDWHQILK